MIQNPRVSPFAGAFAKKVSVLAAQGVLPNLGALRRAAVRAMASAAKWDAANDLRRPGVAKRKLQELEDRNPTSLRNARRKLEQIDQRRRDLDTGRDRLCPKP